MNSHQANLTYASLLPSGDMQLCLDLFPAIQSSYGKQHDAFVSRFNLVETQEIGGLVSLRAEATLPAFLDFLGASWNEAINRWPELAAMVAYRRQHGNDAYLRVADWIQFYQLLSDNVLPARVEVAAIEQP